ncbi:MAG: hypothetical protein ACJ74Y_03205 [Bryobacteraceae bacterium]
MSHPARHGVDALTAALRSKNLRIVDCADDADYVIYAGGKAAASAARQWKGNTVSLPRQPESLTVFRGREDGKPAIAFSGADARGVMYAGLEVAESVAKSTGFDPFEYVQEGSQTPFLKTRGISTYTMQRAYFEQRLYDERYWTRYFDLLAKNRINSFVVIFGYENGGFMAPPYPYFFNTPGFPNVEFVGLNSEGQAKNTAAFKKMLAIAHERGIEVTAGIWDHIYRGGVQAGGIPGAAAEAGKRVPGLVWGVTADNLSEYTKASLRRFLEVFPELDAIQLRMHDESGLKRDEIVPFWHEVFSGIKRDHPNVRLDIRAKDLPDAVINDAVGLGLNAKISTKLWMEQMGLPFHPTHINVQNQKDRRHGYADLLRYPQTYRVNWQLWSGGTARVLLWGDPEYVRRLAASAKLYGGDSLEVNEMLATKMLGEPHTEKPLEILNPKYRYYDYEFERYWHFYQVWGRLMYNPQADPSVWKDDFNAHFGTGAGPHLMEALHLASNVLPRIVAASYLYRNFPTTRGWAEMNRQGSLPQYAGEDGSDIQQFMNVRDEAKSILAGTETPMRRPEETSRWFAQTAEAIEHHVAEAQKASSDRSGKEFQSTVADLRILAGLARYHSARLLAGVSYNLYKQSGDLQAFDDAIASEKQGLDSWKGMVEAAGDIYSENLAFGVHQVGFSRHWKEEYGLLSHDFDQLKKERENATAKPEASHHSPLASVPKPPSAKVSAVGIAEPGHDFPVSARVEAQSGVKSVRLRYRHVTQTEDYQTAEMSLDPSSGSYTGHIPAAFIDKKWDLMYFIEAIGKNGGGRMYPDLEVEQPYVIVSVQR